MKRLLESSRALLLDAEARGLPMRLLGGLAVRLRCPSSSLPPFARESLDADFIALGRSSEIEALFAASGWRGEREFNLYNGHERLIFRSPEGSKADVFVGGFEMCHRIPLERRIGVDPLSIPLAELLLTKLQVYEVNAKDLSDAACILADHELGAGDGELVNAAIFSSLLARDWGLWRTVTANLERVATWAEASIREPGLKAGVLARTSRLLGEVAAARKSAAWTLRSLIGDRARWYQSPEEIDA